VTGIAWTRGPAAKRRARELEIEGCLAVHGLLGGPRSRSHTGGAGEEESFAQRLAAALQTLGPAFSAFGLYLASRVDLLPAAECLALAAIPDRGEPVPLPAVRELLAAELGRPPQEVYPEFEGEPFESRLLFQSHRARLWTGETVTVRCLRPGQEERMVCDLELLDLLYPTLSENGWTALPLGDLLAHFKRSLALEMDLSGSVPEVLGGNDFGLACAPVVVRDLSTRRVLTRERFDGCSLAEISLSPQAAWELSCRLCGAWVRQALLGRPFSVEPRLENLAVLRNGWIVWTGGTVASLPVTLQDTLRSYLAAAIDQDPDRACTHLLQTVAVSPKAVPEEQLRLRLRQGVPFRDGAWSARGESLAEHLFLQWRLFQQCGYRFDPSVLAFTRGLFWIAAVTQGLVSERDALRQGLQEVRLSESVDSLRAMASLSSIRESLELYTMLMSVLPQRMDEALNADTRGRGVQRPVGRQPEGAAGATVLVTSFVLSLTTIILLTRELTAAGLRGAQPVGGLVLIVVGGLFLRALSRGRRVG
jgi:ubiquinone biosynthesis protein